MTSADAQRGRVRRDSTRDDGARSDRVASERRIFSLVLALVASPQGLTKRELLEAVHGYAERYRHGEADAALERQFERDKDHLRELGIPVETVDSPLEPGNNQLTRYRISKELLQIPSEVRFTARELALLRLAALAWSEGSLTAEARRSAMKIEALGAGLDVRHLGIAPSLGLSEAAAPPLQRAIDERRVVRFDYQLPGRDAPLEREVAPLGLHRAEGRWHLIAYDLERSDDRVFLLSRITGPVRLATERFDPALAERLGAGVEELERLRLSRVAAVEARAGSVAESRLAGRGRSVPGRTAGVWRRIEFGTLDFHELAAELAGFGDEVVVDAPPELRGEVLGALGAILAQHGGGTGAADAP